MRSTNQAVDAEYEAYLAVLTEQEAEADAYVECKLDAQDEAITRELSDWHYDPWAPDADDWKYFIDHAAWVRSHTVTDRIVERLTCELDSVEESFHNQVTCVGFVLGHDESACISWLDRSAAPYLRYLSARAGAVVDLIDTKYLEYIGANRLDAVRERALKLSRDAAAEADCVDAECSFESLF